VLTIRTGIPKKPGFSEWRSPTNGCGSARSTAALFEPFFTDQGGRPRCRAGSRDLYGSSPHGGDIEVQSQVGAGTTFRVMIPGRREA